MKSRSLAVVWMSLFALALSGCMNTQPRGNTYGAYDPTPRGTIEHIEQVQSQGGGATGLGAAGGAVAGGLIGNQMGKGKGKTAMTIIGTAAGAYAGHAAEQAMSGPQTEYRINVRLTDGRLVTMVQPDLYNMNIGSHVKIDKNRAVPDRY